MEGRGQPDTGLLRRHGGQVCRDVEDAGFRGMGTDNPGVSLLRFRESERYREQGGRLRVPEPDGLHPLVPQERPFIEKDRGVHVPSGDECVEAP